MLDFKGPQIWNSSMVWVCRLSFPLGKRKLNLVSFLFDKPFLVREMWGGREIWLVLATEHTSVIKSHSSLNCVFWSEFSYWGRCLMGISPTSLFYYKNLDSQGCNVVVNFFIHLYSSNKFKYKQVQRSTNWFGMVFTVMFF